MASGILESLKKVSFVKDAFYLREWKNRSRLITEKREYWSEKGLLGDEMNRVDRGGFRHSFRDAGYTAPNLAMPCDSEGTRDQSNRQQNIKNVRQVETLGDER